jgi:hypothetical protein
MTKQKYWNINFTKEIWAKHLRVQQENDSKDLSNFAILDLVDGILIKKQCPFLFFHLHRRAENTKMKWSPKVNQPDSGNPD